MEILKFKYARYIATILAVSAAVVLAGVGLWYVITSPLIVTLKHGDRIIYVDRRHRDEQDFAKSYTIWMTDGQPDPTFRVRQYTESRIYPRTWWFVENPDEARKDAPAGVYVYGHDSEFAQQIQKEFDQVRKDEKHQKFFDRDF